MGRKKKTVDVVSRTYPVKVRLIKSDSMKEDKIVCNDIELFSFKDTIIEDEKTFVKLNKILKYLKVS